ncbi:hypothetical protein CU098_004135 [Rhizopus stolonifer]|uniref:Rho-GAP domain-containing protein n=1 Tax=Rhizopus stolonifer TaxID=4846 RepID=A0A367IPK0_RHIST|nr:hypothetical protein CU098_004135 [Rhizopus stolonifer]
MLGVFTPSQKALIRGWWKKVTAAHPSARKFKEMRVPVVEKGVFGIPLADSINYASSSISYIDDLTGGQCFGVIPTVVAKCGAFLKEEAMTTEGIFRVSGSTRRIKMLQSIFDTPDNYGAQLNWRGYTVHDAANVMKRFLNFLPEPVITLNCYRKMKTTTLASYSNLDQKIQDIQRIIECLPVAHQYLLLYLLDMLGMFTTTQEYTRMDTACLASVFAPGILSHPDDAMNPTEYLKSQKALLFLIEFQERFSMPRAVDVKSGPVVSRDNVTQNKNLNRPSSNSKLHRAPTIYSCTAGSYSGSGIESIHITTDQQGSLPPFASNLRRSKTAPTGWRNRYYGSHEPQQTVHLNRASSQRRI